MKRKASEITMEEKQERQQSKRERKASEAGSFYAFGHSSADAVLNRYMQSGETHDGSVNGDKVEEQIHKFRGLKNWQQNKRKIEIIDVDDLEEDDHKLADKKIRIEDERTVCHAAEEEYSALLQNMKKRRKGKHVLEEGKKQRVSITRSIPIFEDMWSSFESDHHVNNNGGEGSFWYTNLEDGKAQCVLNQPISKSEDRFTNSVLNFENHHISDKNGDRYFQNKDLEDSNVLHASTELISNSEDILPYSSPFVGDRHGSNNSREGSFSWFIDLEDDKAEWVPYQTILKSEDILSSTLNFESDHHGNNNGGDGYFWNKNLEDASPPCVSVQLISKFEDILPHSSPFSFESNQHHLVGDHHGNSSTNGEFFSWCIDLEDDKAEWVPYQPILKSEDILISTLNFESDHHGNNNAGDRYFWDKGLEDASPLHVYTQLRSKLEDILPNSSPFSFESNQHHLVGDHHGNSTTNRESFSWYIDLEDDEAQSVPNHNDGEKDIWNKDLDDSKALCVVTQLGSKSEDILCKPLPLSFESNHHNAVDDEHGNNNGDNGIFWTKDLEDGNAQCVSTQLISKSEDILSISTLSSESNHQLVVDDHHGNNGGKGSLWDEVLQHAKAVNNTNQ